MSDIKFNLEQAMSNGGKCTLINVDSGIEFPARIVCTDVCSTVGNTLLILYKKDNEEIPFFLNANGIAIKNGIPLRLKERY